MAKLVPFVVVGLVLASACAHPRRARGPLPPQRSVSGTRAELRSALGAHPGYTVDDACRQRDCFVITGTGAHWAPGMERDRIAEDARFRAGFEAIRAALTQTINLLTPVETSGLGGGCREFGVYFWIGDWRVADDAIAAIGAHLAKHDLKEPITLCIAVSNVVPLAGE